jgi:hypothetical protein
MLAVRRSVPGVPFILAAVAVDAFAVFLAGIRGHLGLVENAGGRLLVFTGIVFLTGTSELLAVGHVPDAASELESGMLRIRFCVAGAWLLIGSLTAVSATALQLVLPDGNPAKQSAPRYVQNDAIRMPSSTARKYPQAQGPAQIYLLRGFLNVFSLGMDDLARKLQANGISATAMNHADADFVASRIMTTYNAGDHGPVVLIGHSLGADAVVDVADALARYNIPVALLVLFDGTEPHQIPVNVAAAINYTKHFMITPASGSGSSVSNVDLSGDASIDHLSIDTAPALQEQTLNYILQAASAVPREPGSRP